MDDVKLLLSVESLAHGGRLLPGIEGDLLLSWVAIVMLTLREVGVALSQQVTV